MAQTKQSSSGGNKDKLKDVGKLNPQEYEAIGRQLESIVVSGYAGKTRLITVSLLKGVFTGIGSVIGAGLILVILLWILSGLENVPLIGDVFENVRQTIEDNSAI